MHAWLRRQLPRNAPAPTEASSPAVPGRLDAGAPSPDPERAGRALLAHARALASQLKSAVVQFTYLSDAEALVQSDPFAFLLAVISDMGVRAERAWGLPHELRRRLGYLSPQGLSDHPEAVRAAIQRPPALHRFVNVVPDWLVQASRIVLARHQGEAGRLWSDRPTAMELRRRLEKFPGIAQKKAAIAVDILADDLGTPLRPMNASAAMCICGVSSSAPGWSTVTTLTRWRPWRAISTRTGRVRLTCPPGMSDAAGALPPTRTAPRAR